MTDWEIKMTKELYSLFKTNVFTLRLWNSGPFFDKDGLIFSLCDMGILYNLGFNSENEKKYLFKRTYTEKELDLILIHGI